MSTKRPAEDTALDQRRVRIKLASPSPDRTTESDTESIYSCQGYKTEEADEISETSSPSLPHANNSEYDVAEPEEIKLKYYFSDDSVEEDDVKNYLLNRNSNDSSDNALLGDTSEENSTSPTSNSDVDPGLPRSDYLDFEKCLLCKTDKKDISYPFCSHCFKWRKNFFPQRPRKRRNYKKNEEQAQKTKEGSISDGLFEDSGVGSTQEPQLSEDTVDGPSQASTSSSTETSTSKSEDSNLCKVCFLKPENGLFVHLNIAHKYGCYSCAKEIWYHNGGCPICRRKVFKIIKMFE